MVRRETCVSIESNRSDVSDTARRRTVGVILAGGVGSRAGLGYPKQLARIAGKTVIEHTLDVFETSPDIDEYIVMMEPSSIGVLRQAAAKAGYEKLRGIYPGGRTRNDSSRLALEHVGADDTKVLFHDAVRPFVDHRILADCVSALDSYDAVDTAIPSADTIIEVEPDTGNIKNVPPRSVLRRGQTPQAFRAKLIRDAYIAAVKDENFIATDDCSVVLRYVPGTPIAVVPGTDENMKITAPVDVFVADKLFQLTTTDPVGLDPLVRSAGLADKTVVVFGGSNGIGAAIVEAARLYGANVLAFSRSATNTHVEKRREVTAALAEAARLAGGIDMVVNTAGVLRVGTLESATPKSISESVRVNLMGAINVAQASLPYLRERQGKLLMFTSSSYTRGRASYGVYSATKAAIVNLTQALAEEWAEDGVEVNCVSPQRTHTAMREEAFGEEPEGSLLTPEQVALAAIDTLCADITGHVVDVRLGDGAAH